ncbi:class II fumarate hydratase [uncultured Rhodoblastus sp.]|uniref:class II fumarate hydratase n=1 Tax=uncultured Rhodoblastus sp. TaxID=543037 RepID=UPI0025FB37D8|nr:class II fumarate hydratase [uncultured Rhodoblastus sp.]
MDTFGPVAVAEDRLWGAQTQRSLQNFAIGAQRTPREIIHALALGKKAGAKVNAELGLLDPAMAEAIVAAADEIISGNLDDHFPLLVWQTGSGTQSHMNVNEVIANRANEISFGAPRGAMQPVHPNDHVNLGQSSNDSFPTAMHVAAASALKRNLLPALHRLQGALDAKAREFAGLIKIGRTHLQDATPITLGQEFSGYAAQLALAAERIEAVLPGLYFLAQGGTAVGTGLNAHKDFGARFAHELALETGLPFKPADNFFEALACHDALVFAHGALESAATGLYKIASDIRLGGSGPRAGFAELILPANEPGSSIMPGKVNPTQVEALTMVCARVFGNQTTIAFAASQGQFELNVYKPVIAFAFLESVRLLADSTRSFALHCIEGIKADADKLDETMRRSLMLATALTPKIGYDKAAQVAKAAQANNSSLREEALRLGFVTGPEFDALVRPQNMLAPKD